MRTAVTSPGQSPNAQFRGEKSGFAEFLESKRQEKQSVQDEVRNLALRIASGENVSAYEIDVILSDCNTSASKLQKMVDQATEVLRFVALINAEAADALELDIFQTEIADENGKVWSSIDAIKTLMAEMSCRLHQQRCDVRARTLKSEKIGLAAAEAASTISKDDASAFGIEIPTRNPAVVRDVGRMPRTIDWLDVQTNSLISRKKDEFLELSAAGKLPPIVPIEPPACMFEPEPVKPVVPVEPSGGSSDDVAPLPEGTIDKPIRQSAGIESDDLDDESFDIDQPLDD